MAQLPVTFVCGESHDSHRMTAPYASSAACRRVDQSGEDRAVLFDDACVSIALLNLEAPMLRTRNAEIIVNDILEKLRKRAFLKGNPGHRWLHLSSSRHFE